MTERRVRIGARSWPRCPLLAVGVPASDSTAPGGTDHISGGIGGIGQGQYGVVIRGK